MSQITEGGVEWPHAVESLGTAGTLAYTQSYGIRSPADRMHVLKGSPWMWYSQWTTKWIESREASEEAGEEGEYCTNPDKRYGWFRCGW